MKAEKTRAWIENDRRLNSTLLRKEKEELEVELTELERLAEIGRATEKAFEDKYILMKMGINSKIKGTIKDLLDWVETEGTK